MVSNLRNILNNIRIIPRLDIKGPNLVKGIHLEGLRVLGKPWDYAYKYYTEGADELIYIDAVASLYGRNSLLEIVKKTAEKIFIPLTVGGGVRCIEDINNLLRAGADKVAINTAAVRNLTIIEEASKTFGSQCIVASIQAKNIDGKYFVYTDNARESTDNDVLEWAKRLEDTGAGEILLTSIDREGTGKGYDIELVSSISQTVTIPVIACGGCGKVEDIITVLEEGYADAICVSSILHYNYLDEFSSLDDYDNEGNTEFINKTRGGLEFMKKRLNPLSIPTLKGMLHERSIKCRIS